MISSVDTIKGTLQEAMHEYGKIDAIYLSTWDANPICTVSKTKVESAEASVVSSVMVKLGKLAVLTLNKGELEVVYMQSKKGYVFIRTVSKDMVMTVSTGKDVAIGLLLMMIEDLAGRIGEILSMDNGKPLMQEGSRELAAVIG